MYLQAAKRLNCSVFDLLDRPDADFWLAASMAANEFEARVQDDQQSR